jgi:glycosyltransferase involved in cell wall biosynthesis
MKDVNVIIAMHVNEFPAISQEWINFLKVNVAMLLAIKNPLDEYWYVPTGASVYVGKKLVYKHRNLMFQAPYLIARLKDMTVALYYVLRITGKTHRRFHIFIGIDCLNAFVGLVLRKFGLVEHVIFYPVDYSITRFKNTLLNSLYQILVRLATRESSLMWSVSSRISHFFERQFAASKSKTLIVPHGFHEPPQIRELSRHSEIKKLVYTGGLGPSSGLPLAVEAFSDVVKIIPEAKLYIIGQGSKEDVAVLRKIVKENNLGEYVEFLGVMGTQGVLTFLQQCAIGIAPYSSKESWVQFADCGMKIKEYLACGLPVITTNVTGAGKLVRENQVGITINYRKEDIAAAILKLLCDKNFYEKCRKNTRIAVAEYEWSKILEKAWNDTLTYFVNYN